MANRQSAARRTGIPSISHCALLILGDLDQLESGRARPGGVRAGVRQRALRGGHFALDAGRASDVDGRRGGAAVRVLLLADGWVGAVPAVLRGVTTGMLPTLFDRAAISVGFGSEQLWCGLQRKAVLYAS